MPRNADQPRLWLEAGPTTTPMDALRHHRDLDASRTAADKSSTGCSDGRPIAALKGPSPTTSLEKHAAGAATGVRSPALVPCSRSPTSVALVRPATSPARHARPRETAARASSRLLNYLRHDQALADVNGELCRAYARERGRPSVGEPRARGAARGDQLPPPRGTCAQAIVEVAAAAERREPRWALADAQARRRG